MAPRSKDGRLRLGEPLATELRAFRNVIGMGNSEIGIVRDAVDVFIKGRLRRDKALRALYEAELKRLLASKPLRVAASGGEQK